MINVITQPIQQLCSHWYERTIGTIYGCLATYVYDYIATTYTYLYDPTEQTVTRATTTSRTVPTVTHTDGSCQHYDPTAETPTQTTISPYLSTTCTTAGDSINHPPPVLHATTTTHHHATSEPTKYTALYYYGYRFYDPELGRWVSRDPIGEDGGVNLVAFVGNRSLNNVDFIGLTETQPMVPCPCAESEVNRVAREATKLAAILMRASRIPYYVGRIKRKAMVEHCALVCCSPAGAVYKSRIEKGHWRHGRAPLEYYDRDPVKIDPTTGVVVGGTATCAKTFGMDGEKPLIRCKDDDTIVRRVHTHPYEGTRPSDGDMGSGCPIPLLLVGSGRDDPIRMIFCGKMYQIDPTTGVAHEIDPVTGEPI